MSREVIEISEKLITCTLQAEAMELVALCYHNLVAFPQLPCASEEAKQGFMSLSVLEHSMNICGCLRIALRFGKRLWHLETTFPMNSSAPHPRVSQSLRNSSAKGLINLYKF